MAGDFEEAIALGRAATAEQRAMVGTPRLVDALAILCGALLMNGDLEAARCATLEAWPLALQDDWTGDHLSHVALLAARAGRFAQAAQMLGHAQTWFAARPGALEPNQLRSMTLARSAIETALEPAERERLFASGERMGSAEIDALVRSVLAVPIEQSEQSRQAGDS